MIGTIIGGIVFLVLFLVILTALVFIFWIWMLIDCLKRDFRKDHDKIVWALVIIFLHFIGAIIYYFVIKADDKKDIKKK